MALFVYAEHQAFLVSLPGYSRPLEEGWISFIDYRSLQQLEVDPNKKCYFGCP